MDEKKQGTFICDQVIVMELRNEKYATVIMKNKKKQST